MGTQGKKNTPITARVNAGLFNQKKGITEPLLNVGPAGVYGDNQTKDIPSPSKMRGYAKRSPFKQKNEGDVTVKKEIKGPDTTKTVTVPGTPGTENYDQAIIDNGSTILDRPATPEETRIANKRIADGLAADVAAAKPIEKEIVVKGETKKSEEPVLTRDDVDAFQPWEVRQQSRSIKKSGKDVRQSQNKLDATNRKLKKLEDAGVTSGKKFSRLTAKQAENTSELGSFEKNQTNRDRQVEISANPNRKTTYKGVERNLRQSDATTSTRNKLVDADLLNDVSGVSNNAITGNDNDTNINTGINPLTTSTNKEVTAVAEKRGYTMRGSLYK